MTTLARTIGEFGPDLMDALGVDVVGLGSPKTLFGFRNENWKPWTFFDGTPVLVPEGFNTIPEPDGSILMYPQGDRSVKPSARMPKDGYYFDNIERQEPIDEGKLNPEDNCEFLSVTPELLGYLAHVVDQLYSQTDKAILANYYGAGFGDQAGIPGPWLKEPRGIRSVAEWYVSLATRPDLLLPRSRGDARSHRAADRTRQTVGFLFHAGTRPYSRQEHPPHH